MTESINTLQNTEEQHYCAVHPERDTELRCNRCERYMCIDCAVRTPVGYTCNNCVRGHEDKFFAGTNKDYAIVASVAFVGGAVGAFAIALIGGFWLLALIIAPTIGGGIGQLALSLTGRRRGRQTAYVCAGAVLSGGLATAFLVTGLGIGTLIYLGLATSSAYASMKVAI